MFLCKDMGDCFKKYVVEDEKLNFDVVLIEFDDKWKFLFGDVD